jgi:hypothetical protein
MAITINGKRIGAAAASEKRDIREYVEMVSNPNGEYWKARLQRAFDQIVTNPSLADVWESDLVPAHTTYQEHAILAEKIVSGELTLDDANKNGQPPEQDG